MVTLVNLKKFDENDDLSPQTVPII